MNKIKKVLFVVALLGTSTAVFAQTAPGSNASGTSTAGAQASGGALTYAPTTNSEVRYPASTAIAPAIGPTAPCMGSSGVGVSGASFGIALGTTWKDEDCKIIRDSSQLWNMGLQKAAIARLCDSDDFKYAISVSGGIPIPGPTKGSFYMVGCPMTKDDWVKAGRPTLDPVTGQPAKLGVLIAPPAPMPAPDVQIQSASVAASKTELHAIAIEAKEKYGIDLALREASTEKLQK